MEKTGKMNHEKMASMKAMFEPKSVAVIGASRRKEAVGHAILANLISGGFKGALYPVNPKIDKICDLVSYPSVLNTPGPVDLAVIILPAAAVLDTVKECVKKQVKAIIIISAGFREVGPEGRKLEEEVIGIARKAGISILGPNCLGLINPDPKFSLNASFSKNMPKSGKIAFISQSGALCAAILDYAEGEHIGFSKFISAGNKADINELDLLRYLKDDPETGVILMYVEDLADGNGFIETVRELISDKKNAKPVIVVKSGRTPQGAKAAASHTGSLMGSDEIYDAIFTQAGALRVNSVEEMFDCARAIVSQPLPKTNRVVIVTNAGGPGIMATDACVRYGLEMATLSPETVATLKGQLPPSCNFSNPVDVLGDAQHDRYQFALTTVLKDPNVDSVLVITTPQAMTEVVETAQTIVDVAKTTKKTMAVCYMGGAEMSKGMKILEAGEVPHYIFPGETARVLGHMVRFKSWMERPVQEVKNYKVDTKKAAQILEKAKASGYKLLDVAQSMDVLKAYGFPVPPCGVAKSDEEAVKIANEMRYPVVLKIVSNTIVHKLDVGGVLVNLKNEEDVRAGYRHIMESARAKGVADQISGILVQAMGKKGREVILGMKRDAHFGPVLMFGLGGTFVEVFKDVSFRLAPIRQLNAKTMIETIRSYPILKGVRGQGPADMNVLMDCLQRLSQLSCEQSLIEEIDVNPLFVYDQGEGADVIDARMLINLDKA